MPSGARAGSPQPTRVPAGLPVLAQLMHLIPPSLFSRRRRSLAAKEAVLVQDKRGHWQLVKLRKLTGDSRRLLMSRVYRETEDEGLGFFARVRERLDRWWSTGASSGGTGAAGGPRVPGGAAVLVTRTAGPKPALIRCPPLTTAPPWPCRRAGQACRARPWRFGSKT